MMICWPVISPVLESIYFFPFSWKRIREKKEKQNSVPAGNSLEKSGKVGIEIILSNLITDIHL